MNSSAFVPFSSANLRYINVLNNNNNNNVKKPGVCDLGEHEETVPGQL